MTLRTSATVRLWSPLSKTLRPGVALKVSARLASSWSGSTWLLSSQIFLSVVIETMTDSESLFSCSMFFASGIFTSLPRWSIGVTTMKMMRRTRTTSTRGVTLISFLTPLAPPTLIAMTETPGARLLG